MKLIKSAIVYKATIPTDTTALHNHLTERVFNPPMALELRSAGFIPVNEESGCTLVSAFPGGLAFRVRIDEKVMPGSVIKAEVEKQVENIVLATGRKPGKKARAEIKEAVIADLAQRALVRTAASITCYYHEESGFLIVPTTSQKIADTCVTLLVHAVGSVKTETIHVSDVKHGLTTRLKNWLGGDMDAFGAFNPCDQAALADTEGRKLNVKMGSLQTAREGLEAAIRRDFSVTSLGFGHQGVEFRLTDGFRIKGLRSVAQDDQMREVGDDPWVADAMEQVETVVGIISELVELLSYKDPCATEGGAA